MTIAYDGSDLYGWQVQKKGRTVQGDIETAFKKIFKDDNINLIGAGRTDSGVHASEQTANIKINTEMGAEKLKNALNGNLQNDIYISECKEVIQDFHSRFSAIKRKYKYKIRTSFSPVNRNYVWSLDDNLDIDKLHHCAKLVLGEHDFTQLSKKNDELENKICHVYDSQWEINGYKIDYTIKANRFLHHMVRYLVGVMIEISKNNILSIKDFKSMIDGLDRKMIFKAPSKGLYLEKIYYD